MKHVMYVLMTMMLILFVSGCTEAPEQKTSKNHEEKTIKDNIGGEEEQSSSHQTDKPKQEHKESVNNHNLNENESLGEDKKVLANRMEVELLYVIDGDTIKVSINGREESVRFLLVDTPETSHPQLGKQPFGEEAKAFTKKLLSEREVLLEKDVGERDKYGRLLMYVYTPDGRSVQEELLKNGLARVAYVYAPNTKYVDRYRAIEQNAAKSGVGIWAVDGYAHLEHEHGFHTEKFEKEPSTEKDSVNTDSTFPPDPNGNCGGKIKGNRGSNGWIYHIPDGMYYERTKAEECFSTEQAAKNAGYRASTR